MGSRDGNTPFADSVRPAIASLLASGHPPITRAAAAAGCSVRTLQRRLARDGLTYRQLVDDVRFREARRLIVDPKLRLIDITSHLGFADAGSFTRAFERWSGVAPRNYRRLIRARAGVSGLGARRTTPGAARKSGS